MFLRRVSSPLCLSKRLFSTGSGHEISNAITELNKEMDSVFGEPPSGNLGGSVEHQFHSDESHTFCLEAQEKKSGLTHVGSKGEAQMVDVSPKENSKRVAIASCEVILGREVFNMVSDNQMAKGDVLGVSKIAGINGAKQTSNLIPLCHNINLTHVGVELQLNPQNCSVKIEGEASSTGKTGVEMEAMTAVTIAGLTVYDMCKAASKDIQITNIRLERKTGGKSGVWSREETDGLYD